MPFNTKPHLARSLFCAACVALAAASSGCAKDEVGKLFDENGVWSLVEYDLSGTSPYQSLNEWRRGGFLMRFDPGVEKVAVATCQDDDDHTAGLPGNPTDSTCVVAGEVEFWYCDCFLYAFEENQMCWKEADAGGGMPAIATCGDVPDIPDGGDDGGTNTGGDGGTNTGGDGGTNTGSDGGTGTGTGAGVDDGGARTGAGYGETPETLITLNEDLEVASTYIFQPLPLGVYGSREFSRFKIQQKANNLFDGTGCSEACGM